MNVTEAISDLITTYRKVSIPGLGSLEHRTRPAEIQENRISPPSEGLVFDPTHTSDDKKLRTYLAEHNQLEPSVAAKVIAHFVADLKKRVEAGETFSFPGIGSLSFSEESQWTFDADPEAFFSYDFYGLDDIKISPDFNAPITPDTMEKIQDAPETTTFGEWVVVAPEDFFETKATADKRNRISYKDHHRVIRVEIKLDTPNKTMWKGWVVADPDNFFETKKSADKQNMISYNSLHKVVFVELDEPKEEAPSSNRFTKIFFGLLTLAILAFGVNYLYPKIFGDKANSDTAPTEKSTAKPIAKPVADSLVSPDSSATTPTVLPARVVSKIQGKPAQPQDFPVLTPDPKVKFYVVISSFETQRRAKKFMRELAAKGVHGDLVTFGESRYRVVTGGFTDEAKAQQSQESIKTQPLCEGAWVLTNP